MSGRAARTRTEAFRQARDLLIEHLGAQEAAHAAFVWPGLDELKARSAEPATGDKADAHA